MLDLHPDKTRLIEFGRFAQANRKRRGLGKPETFNFMGMTHYCTTTRGGKFRVGRKPLHKRVRRTLKRIKEELQKRMHLGEHAVARWLGYVIRGWLNYYAVPGTFRELEKFVEAVKRLLLRTMRRRSQKDRYSWSALERLISFHWQKPTIRHPWPDQRLTVKTKLISFHWQKPTIRHPWPDQRLTVKTKGRSRFAALAHFSDVVHCPKVSSF